MVKILHPLPPMAAYGPKIIGSLPPPSSAVFLISYIKKEQVQPNSYIYIYIFRKRKISCSSSCSSSSLKLVGFSWIPFPRGYSKEFWSAGLPMRHLFSLFPDFFISSFSFFFFLKPSRSAF